jgi:hypothetical protein
MRADLPYRLAASPESARKPLERRVADPDEHERQLTLVCASLLLSRRPDLATHRRWA